MITETRKKRRSWLLVLLLIPFIAMLWPPFYKSTLQGTVRIKGYKSIMHCRMIPNLYIENQSFE